MERGRWFGKARRGFGAATAIIFANPGPSGPAGFLTRTQILRAGNVLPTPRDNPRKWGPGKGDYEHEVLIWSRPRRSFGFFPIVGKETRPAGRNSPAYNKCSPKPAPSSGPFGATFPYPLCRFATSPLDKGSRPPRGRLLGGFGPLTKKGSRKAGQRRGGEIPRTLYLLWLKPPQSGFNKEGSTHETNQMRKRRNLQT